MGGGGFGAGLTGFGSLRRHCLRGTLGLFRFGLVACGGGELLELADRQFRGRYQERPGDDHSMLRAFDGRDERRQPWINSVGRGFPERRGDLLIRAAHQELARRNQHHLRPDAVRRLDRRAKILGPGGLMGLGLRRRRRGLGQAVGRARLPLQSPASELSSPPVVSARESRCRHHRIERGGLSGLRSERRPVCSGRWAWAVAESDGGAGVGAGRGNVGASAVFGGASDCTGGAGDCTVAVPPSGTLSRATSLPSLSRTITHTPSSRNKNPAAPAPIRNLTSFQGGPFQPGLGSGPTKTDELLGGIWVSVCCCANGNISDDLSVAGACRTDVESLAAAESEAWQRSRSATTALSSN